MYNKLFSKILDSTIWLESDPVRIVWITFLAAMDQDGFCPFASDANVARRANVPLDAAQQAIEKLEGPDIKSGDPSHQGRRIERVPGGWIVFNAKKYQALANAHTVREQNRKRAQEYRERKKKQSEDTVKGESRHANVTASNGLITHRNGNVTPSDTDTDIREGKHYVRELEGEKASPLSGNVRQVMKDKFWAAFDKVKPDANLGADADEWRRLRLAADKCGYLYKVVKEEILRSHPRYGAWEFTEQFDSQEQIKFPEATKTGTGIGEAVREKKKALAAKEK